MAKANREERMAGDGAEAGLVSVVMAAWRNGFAAPRKAFVGLPQVIDQTRSARLATPA